MLTDLDHDDAPYWLDTLRVLDPDFDEWGDYHPTAPLLARKLKLSGPWLAA
ncbi:hypothetical protein [Enterovirga aerilata]|uniref:Uncharacterized protein n=1 Tax=Enterovirga aerilata TaxID=2730920 RepID=A0A849ICY2_9HYPH|nr:hypothetical protein [Enterovirga sp. DB1703]NNM73847.1 hypothetical protein [Enterovirga sp. DB1703]